MKKIATSVLSLLLIVAILAPSVLKLSHAFFEHHEQLCQELSSVHIHEIELDCDFQKYKLSSLNYPTFSNVDVPFATIPKKEIFNYYSFLSKYQKLHFALRGPPVS